MNSLSKNQLKCLAAYRQQKRCDEEGVFVVEGVKMCSEALQSGFAIRTVCGTADFLAAHGNKMGQCSEVYEVNAEQLERLSNQRTPNKVWMVVERKIQNSKFKIQNSNLLLALDGLQDPGNMGTIMRTADWYGIRRIVCSRDTVNCYNPKVVQATMGAIFRTEVIYCDLAEWLGNAAKEGYTTYGALLDGVPYQTAALQRPAVLVIGNEGKGISREVAASVQHRLTIPNIGGTCESLNAAVATAILCSEFYR
jgi:TrmH family RNA methyltransferase